MRFVNLAWPVRVLWLGLGLMWFVWLGVEDRGVLVVLLLATAVSFTTALTGLDRWSSGKTVSEWQWWVRWLMQGLVSAMAIAPLAILMIAVKTSLHAHAIPDFSLTSVRRVLGVWPAWGAGSFFVSLGIGALGRARAGETGV
jgi:hypothetical protein